MELHGGSIDARSEGLGCGSTFEIRLPRIARPEPASVEPAAIQGASRRVLIVDDNADAATAISMLLSLQGHETQVALSGKEALAQIDAFRPEIALLDIGLPEMSGYELAQRLRACPDLAGLRLIALSGFGQAEDQERTRAAGFDHHLVKPVDLQVLDRALRTD